MGRFRQLKNWWWLLCGYTLYNSRGYRTTAVRWDWKDMRQLWTNTNRKKPYKLDDEGWFRENP